MQFIIESNMITFSRLIKYFGFSKKKKKFIEFLKDYRVF